MHNNIPPAIFVTSNQTTTKTSTTMRTIKKVTQEFETFKVGQRVSILECLGKKENHYSTYEIEWVSKDGKKLKARAVWKDGSMDSSVTRFNYSDMQGVWRRFCNLNAKWETVYLSVK